MTSAAYADMMASIGTIGCRDKSGRAVLILVGQDAILIWTTVGQRLVDEKTMDVEPFPIIDQLLA